MTIFEFKSFVMLVWSSECPPVVTSTINFFSSFPLVCHLLACLTCYPNGKQLKWFYAYLHKWSRCACISCYNPKLVNGSIDQPRNWNLNMTKQTNLFSNHKKRGLHGTNVAFLLLIQQPQVWLSALPKIYFNVAEIFWKY